MRLHDVIVFGREAVRQPCFNPQTFRFGVAVAREKLIHFHLKCHFSLPFLFLGLSDGRRKARDKVPARSYLGGAGAGASSLRGFFRWVRADSVSSWINCSLSASTWWRSVTSSTAARHSPRPAETTASMRTKRGSVSALSRNDAVEGSPVKPQRRDGRRDRPVSVA